MAKKTTKSAAKPRAKPKTRADAPGAKSVQSAGAKGPAAKSGAARPTPAEQAEIEARERELFLQYRTRWIAWQAKVRVLEKDTEVPLKAELKSAGFTVKQFQIADELTALKGEKKVTAEVRDRVRVARWIGHPLGKIAAQLDLFDKPASAVQTVDDAFEVGERESMGNKPRRPPAEYPVGGELYNAYMAGYNAHQGKLAEGFKAPAPRADDAPAPSPIDEAFTGEPEAKTQAAGADEPLYGDRVTRSQFSRQLRDLGQDDGAGGPPAKEKVH